jgi:hypothetical protein
MEVPLQIADDINDMNYYSDIEGDIECDIEGGNNEGICEGDSYDSYDSNPITNTANGGKAFKSTGSSIVDYFMLFMRDLSIADSYNHLEKCWKEDPKKTVAIIFNGRDRLNGKKEKRVANEAMLWLRKNKLET